MRSERYATSLQRRILRSALLLPACLLLGCGSSSGGGDDDPLPPLPRLSISAASAAEGDSGSSALTFDVSLSAASADDVSFDVVTSNGSATAGEDYIAVSDTVTLAAGAVTAAVDVQVTGDTLYERDENFSVTIRNPVNATISAASVTGTIGNDDLPPSMSIADSSVAEGDGSGASLTFVVSLSAASGTPASALFTTADGSAAAGSDYVAESGTVTFPAGSTSRSVTIDILGDTDEEGDESFTVTLSGAMDATLADATATGTIVDDDEPGGVTTGLDTRPQNLTCIAPARPDEDVSVSVVDAYPGLPDIAEPTKILLEPVADPRWFVLQKSGRVLTFDPDNATSTSLYLQRNVRDNSEGGMLGMAFHPDYPAVPEVFLSYTVGPPMRSVIERVILDDVQNPTEAGSTGYVVLEVDQDFDNHNGGDIAFGPDGYLYFGLGDGGSGNDPNNRSQDTTRLLGSMLRIDVLAPTVSYPGNPYEIPADNPFAANAECGPAGNANDCPEIYAWGLRNPWRWSFDVDTGELWLADVGQGAFEEVNLIELGGNYGWPCREGFAAGSNQTGCTSGYDDPVSVYSQALGNSITGGHVYRGSAMPSLDGRYVFADFGTGRFWALAPDGHGGYVNDELDDTNTGPTSFGVGPDDELYITDYYSSRIRKLEPSSGGSDTIPDSLADTGCTDPADITQPYAGLVPYGLNAPFWSDGADKDRWLGLPDGTTITRAGDDDWEFPTGTVIVKNFRLDDALVETRHLMRHPDGSWAGYTYEWNDQQTAATRVRGGKTVSIAGQDYIFPSEGQCMECHTSAAGFSLGLETAQLNRDFTYPSTQRTANQLETLDHIIMFASPLPGPASGLPVMARPDDSSASLEARARAYLHTNCSQCHRPGGPAPSTMDLRYATDLQDTDACDVQPQQGDLGIGNARLIAPGDASRSLVVVRANRRDSNGMPPLGSSLVDDAGVALLTSWINGLGACN